jgi:hypothetical protein
MIIRNSVFSTVKFCIINRMRFVDKIAANDHIHLIRFELVLYLKKNFVNKKMIDQSKHLVAF